jgi:septal ring-binding cell division protein DamX
MLKRFSHFAACLLLILMPIQALATANMLVCNSMMQVNTEKQSIIDMPCHQQMHDTKSQPSHQSTYKSNCASLCANLCALIAMPVQIQSAFAINLTQAFDFNHQIYASIPQQNLQRPPISFI